MKKLRGAVVGYGFIMEEGHAAGYRQRARRRDRRDRRHRARAPRGRPGSSGRRRASTPIAAALLAAEAGRLDFVDIATPPERPRARSRTRRSIAACTCCARSRSRPASTRRARCCGTRRGPSASSTPATTTSTRRSSRRCARPRLGADRQGPPRDAADLPQHARQGRHGLAHRLAARAPLLGRRHRHGSRQPHLLPGVRVAARLPDGDQRARRRRWGPSTPRTTSRAACASRPASPRRTCRGTRACAR